MTEQFPVVAVKPVWVSSPEEMGSKSKFWFQRMDQGDSEWLFKFPQANTGQHWSEKIAAEVADSLQVRHAHVELAEFEQAQGSITKSFVLEGMSLHHGNQLLEMHLSGYHDAEGFRQSSHTLGRIWEVLGEIFQETGAIHRAKVKFASYLVLDAVIGNTDRHHEHWGVLRCLDEDGPQLELAPSFDHASSLGRELLDDRRCRHLTDSMVGHDSRRGRGAVYWSERDSRGPSPVELVKRGAELYPDLFLPGLLAVVALPADRLRIIVNRIPGPWMSAPARSFALELMGYNIRQLEELVR